MAIDDTPPVIEDFTNDTYAKQLDQVFRSMARGSFANQMQQFLVGLDRYQSNLMPSNVEQQGYTFITRPRLCLESGNLRSDRVFAPLDANSLGDVVTSMQYMIRCLLDTKFCKKNYAKYPSPLIDNRNPFFTPLCNGLTSLSGFPDPVLQTATTEAGFHSEDQTFGLGHDNLAKSYDLSLSFKDIQHGPLASIVFYWLRYMFNVMRGTMLAYSDDIEQQRMNYTVSIYRFTLDPARKYIPHFAKATGCIPKSVPFGALFNYNASELYIPAAGQFTVPFVTNRIEYMDYAIVQDFNMLAQRYWPDIDTPGKYYEAGDYLRAEFLKYPETENMAFRSQDDWILSFADADNPDTLPSDAFGEKLIQLMPNAYGRFKKMVRSGELSKTGSDNFSGRPFLDTSTGRLRLSWRLAVDELK